MPSHNLILEKDASRGQWLLQWDKDLFRLVAPGDDVLLEAEPRNAHRYVEIYELYAEGKVSLETPEGSYTFRPHSQAVSDLRGLVESALRSDAEYRAFLKRRNRVAIGRGIVMLVVPGGLFALYCWWASWAPDPSPGHWLRWFGWLIHLVLIVLLAAALAGPAVCYVGLKQLALIRQIEHGLANYKGVTDESREVRK